jgi:phosphoribosylformylglycinamidine synthase
MASRIEVRSRKGIDSRGEALAKRLNQLIAEGAIPKAEIESAAVSDAYSFNMKLSAEELETIARMLHDPVSQEASIQFSHIPDDASYVIEVGFKPGVTDNVATTVKKGIEAKLRTEFQSGESVHSTQVYTLRGCISEEAAQQIGYALANPLIQRIAVHPQSRIAGSALSPYVPKVVLEPRQEAAYIPVTTMTQNELKSVAKRGITDPITGIPRGPLALDIDDAKPMKIIAEYFRKEGRNPTDVELEVLAQTWSEHCKHTIFAASLDIGSDNPVPEGLFNRYIRGATEEIIETLKNTGEEGFLLSVFRDNSGIVRFDDKWAITDKAETHNSPSALDPYGGAITGIVGVDRDALGAGLGAMPFAHRFYFCFADPKSKRQLYKSRQEDGTLAERVLSPRSIMEGVISGVKDGGNKSGIPTPQGGAYFDSSYGGKPLVFVGVLGLLPLESAGRKGYEKSAKPGDLVVMAGGRVGLDGIHGATFSSEAMDSGSPVSAVQIGDPITQKKLSDAICREARELGLYNSITDNGAGGLSCSVFEMARECGGASVEIDKIPLKYPGMRDDQILISESQERMTFAVPKENFGRFTSLLKKHDAEATVIGEFNDSGRCTAKSGGRTVLDIDINFLHDGLPQRKLVTSWTPEIYRHEEPQFEEPKDLTAILHSLLSRPNICSKEFISRQFDHEVQGGSVIKPLVGKGKADSDATVTRPVLTSMRGVATTQALFPRYGLIDTYNMAACAIDAAVRNLIAVGGKMHRMALLDNFCWCSSDEPERLGQLKRAAQACHDVAVAYLTPFISGKDSMFNTFRGFDEHGKPVKIDVLPTLLISGLSIVPDVRKCQTPEAKMPGDLVYIVGETANELGGSEYLAMMGEMLRGKAYTGNNVPSVLPQSFTETYHLMQMAIEAGFVASCASIGTGGMAAALAKAGIGGMLGMDINLDNMMLDEACSTPMRPDTILFSESAGRFIATVDPAMKNNFEELFSGAITSRIGKATNDDTFTVRSRGNTIIDAKVSELHDSYRKTLKDY